MPIDLEMFLSASPPNFTHSGFLDFHYDLYYRNAKNKRPNTKQIPKTKTLISDQSKCTKIKKRVRFADDKGLALTVIHHLPEPVAESPDEYLEEITRGIKPQVASDSTWQPSFPQPSSNYQEFRAKLEQRNVALENAVARDGDDAITGTIKVKNLSYEKEVFVRATFDRWINHTDFPATYVNSATLMDRTSVDTFAFQIQIPSKAEKFEVITFCVCFRSKDGEFWDSYDGSNYRMVLVRRKTKEVNSVENVRKFSELDVAEFDSWAEFASWNNLITVGPYW